MPARFVLPTMGARGGVASVRRTSGPAPKTDEPRPIGGTKPSRQSNRGCDQSLIGRHMMALQRSAGNQAVVLLLQRRTHDGDRPAEGIPCVRDHGRVAMQRSHADLVVQRAPNKKTGNYEYQVKVPADFTTLDQMFRLFERVAYGKEMNLKWRCNDYCDMSKNAGTVVSFLVSKAEVESMTDPEVTKKKDEAKASYRKLAGQAKKDVADEASRRFYEVTGQKPGSRIKPGEEGKARTWEQQLSDVLEEQKTLQSLPAEVKVLMGPESSYKPKDHRQLLRIAEKLKTFGPEDLAVYKLLTIRATDNLDLFEKSIDTYLARKEELKKALAEEAAKSASGSTQGGGGPPQTLQEEIAQQWKDLDESSLGAMSEADRYRLAREKASQLTEAQLRYMKEHPGKVGLDFLKSATLMNTSETFSGIAKDLKEAASGDANSFARWAAGVGAGAKLSGWLLAVAGIVFVASWLTGVGELVTIAAAAGVLLGSTLVLSGVESELRIHAAGQAKTPEEFKRNVELAAAARTNLIVGVALVILAAVLHFTAKALFPKQVQAIKTSLKNFREKIRLKGSVYKLKPEIKADMAQRKLGLAASAEAAKQKAKGTATDIDGLTTEEFVAKLEKGDGVFLDQSKLPADKRVDFSGLLKTKEGRRAIEQYRQKLIDALEIDVPAEIDALVKKHTADIDEFLQAVEDAKNHDDLGAATSKLEASLSEQKLKEFAGEQQAKLTEKKLEEAAVESHQEFVAFAKDLILRRVTARIAAQADKLDLVYTPSELDAIIAKGKELGLGDRVIEDMICIGSRKAKAMTAQELLHQMELLAKGPRSFGPAAEGYRPDGVFMKWIHHPMPREGWKLHVSADVVSAAKTAEFVLPALRKMGVNHKVAGTLDDLAGMSASGKLPYLDATQLGKFITIYPDNIAQARTVVSTLDQLLSGQSGPAVAGERPVGTSGVIYTRYGGFTKSTVTAPNGMEVKDVRGRIRPPWIDDPW